MDNTEKNTIVLGVTGSIAAYKAAQLVSLLTKASCDVNVVMTENAQRFITPLTFQTLSRNPVITSLWDEPKDWRPQHIELAIRAWLLLIAPASADILAKMANGIADDALSTYYLSHTGKVLVAPAMNPRMWNHPATRHNCQILRERGVIFCGPAEGTVACGEAGPGRMVEPQDIFGAIKAELQ